MPASSSKLFVCAGLALGALGVGGHYLTNRDTPEKVTNAEPLFARSVEEAGLPAGRWPVVRLDVPYYGPMVELLTLGASAGRTATVDQPPPQVPPHAARETPRGLEEAVEVRKQQKQTRRIKEKRPNDAAAIEADAREAYAKEVQERKQRRGSTQGRDDEGEGDRAIRRSRTRQHEFEEPINRRRQEDQRQQAHDRSFTREDRREEKRREVRSPENRDVGSTPFRLFGIFEQR
jgi:hypothetical protein